LLNPYNTRRQGNILFFSTDSGAEYQLYFSDGDGYFPNYPDIAANFFVFGFASIGSVKTKQDPRIRDTVLTAIIDYLSTNKNNGLVYVCDNHGRTDISRNRLFGRWGKNVEVNISKYDTIINDGDDNPAAYLSLLIHDGCAHYQEMVDAFMAMNDDLRDKGY